MIDRCQYLSVVGQHSHIWIAQATDSLGPNLFRDGSKTGWWFVSKVGTDRLKLGAPCAVQFKYPNPMGYEPIPNHCAIHRLN